MTTDEIHQCVVRCEGRPRAFNAFRLDELIRRSLDLFEQRNCALNVRQDLVRAEAFRVLLSLVETTFHSPFGCCKSFTSFFGMPSSAMTVTIVIVMNVKRVGPWLQVED
jgi:hypothetical protein